MASFTHVAQDVSPQYGRVTKITIRVCVTDCTGTVYITDMLLQGGSIATGWVGHVSEIQWTDKCRSLHALQRQLQKSRISAS